MLARYWAFLLFSCAFGSGNIYSNIYSDPVSSSSDVYFVEAICDEQTPLFVAVAVPIVTVNSIGTQDNDPQRFIPTATIVRSYSTFSPSSTVSTSQPDSNAFSCCLEPCVARACSYRSCCFCAVHTLNDQAPHDLSSCLQFSIRSIGTFCFYCFVLSP